MNEKPYTDWVREILGEDIDLTKEKYGDQSTVFQIHASSGDYYLKIGQSLQKEYARLNWLQGKILVPEGVGFWQNDGEECLLMTAIQGRNLASLIKEWSPEKIVDKLVSALQDLHAVDIQDCPFGVLEKDSVLVHGDACLPNLLFDGENFAGYVDLGDLMIAHREVDFAAAIWSLEYNLGSGYGGLFLEKYGVKGVSDALVEKLRLKY